ncbi:MAG: hypothetical protein R3F43_08705 [bacterium]
MGPAAARSQVPAELEAAVAGGLLSAAGQGASSSRTRRPPSGAVGWLRGRGKGHAVLLRQDARPRTRWLRRRRPGWWAVGRSGPADDALVRRRWGAPRS